MLCWCCVRRTANESPYHTPSHLFRQNDPFFMAKFNNPWLIQQPLICRPSELLWSSSHSSPANLSLSPRPMVASPSIPRRAVRGTLNCCRRDWGQQRLMYYSKVNLLKCESSNFQWCIPISPSSLGWWCLWFCPDPWTYLRCQLLGEFW